jgi:Ca-activated chloride channel family protein
VRQFAHPAAFALLLLVLAHFVIVLLRRRRGSGAFAYSSVRLFGARRSWRVSSSWIPLLIELAGLTLIVVALARPQEVTQISNERFGIDLVITLDASGSMAAEDFHPRNRFTVARELITQFIEKRENDRIGIVTFGARAATRVPITFDRDIAKEVLAKAQVGENGDGTAIGHAIATSVNRLRNSPSRSKVIVLLTDGVNNAGSIEPATAAQLAARYGVKIYAIGIGSRGISYAPMKFQDPITGEIRTESVPIRADIDEEAMRGVAKTTGGEYYRATDRQALGNVLARIDQLEKSRLSAPKRENVRELYPLPLSWGLAAMAAALLLGESVWMRLPA